MLSRKEGSMGNLRRGLAAFRMHILMRILMHGRSEPFVHDAQSCSGVRGSKQLRYNAPSYVGPHSSGLVERLKSKYSRDFSSISSPSHQTVRHEVCVRQCNGAARDGELADRWAPFSRVSGRFLELWLRQRVRQVFRIPGHRHAWVKHATLSPLAW